MRMNKRASGRSILLKKVRLGKSGLMVTEVGFGGIPIQRLSEEGAVEVVQRCIDMGVNFLDTAHGYGTSEERIGKAISGRREGLILATKSPARDGDAFREQMELSFERLGVKRIDLYQFHNVSSQEAYEQVVASGGPLDVAREARDAGRIDHIGFTSHSLDVALQAVPSGHFETLMFPFNFVTDEPAERLLPLCEEHDVGFIAMKPMAGGLLGNATLAFKYLRQYPSAIPLVGIEAAQEMEEIVAIMEAPAELTAAERREIERLRQELGDRFCRRCGYCMPCPQDISIPMMMNLRSFAKRFPAERMFGEWGTGAVAVAETCIECEECIARCPYDLPIPEIIRQNVAWYNEQMALRQ
jgi:hypothetical protein